MMSDVSGSGKESLPQIWASSISTKKDLVPAIAEVRLFMLHLSES